MIRCLAVDDSPLALDLLESYIQKVDFLSLERKCNNAVEAIDVLGKNNIDVVFLDIQMPDVTGIDLLKTLHKKPKVIFTTAYPEYAVEGFDLDATDYLLKPFSFERFLKAVQKVQSQLLAEQENEISENEKTFLFVKSGYESVKIFLQDILYVEAMKDYVQFVTPGKKILSLKSMKDVLEEVPEEEFIRVHRSFIVSKSKITKVTSQKIFIGQHEIPLGDIFRPAFLEWFNEKKR